MATTEEKFEKCGVVLESLVSHMTVAVVYQFIMFILCMM